MWRSGCVLPEMRWFLVKQLLALSPQASHEAGSSAHELPSCLRLRVGNTQYCYVAQTRPTLRPTLRSQGLLNGSRIRHRQMYGQLLNLSVPTVKISNYTWSLFALIKIMKLLSIVYKNIQQIMLWLCWWEGWPRVDRALVFHSGVISSPPSTHISLQIYVHVWFCFNFFLRIFLVLYLLYF